MTGAGGMLGRDVVAELQRRGLAVVALDRAGCDVTDAAACRAAIEASRADIVINCAAYTDVNGAETHMDEAMAVNAEGAANVARACHKTGVRLIHVSTDYVFDGTKETPYESSDAVNPVNAYGSSKLAGEQLIAQILPEDQWAVVRTSWLFGAHGPNFVKTMLRLGRDGKELKIIEDQVGAPTYTKDLAVALVDLALAGATGVIHATASVVCSWFEFASEIFRLSGVVPKTLAPCPSAEFPTPAARPANSRLSSDSLTAAGVSRLPDWRNALKQYLDETGELQQ